MHKMNYYPMNFSESGLLTDIWRKITNFEFLLCETVLSKIFDLWQLQKSSKLVELFLRYNEAKFEEYTFGKNMFEVSGPADEWNLKLLWT